MTVRLSYDECKTWPVAKLLHAGPAAYWDFCIAADRMICCLYEGGKVRAYDSMRLARFTLDWLTASKARF